MKMHDAPPAQQRLRLHNRRAMRETRACVPPSEWGAPSALARSKATFMQRSSREKCGVSAVCWSACTRVGRGREE